MTTMERPREPESTHRFIRPAASICHDGHFHYKFLLVFHHGSAAASFTMADRSRYDQCSSVKEITNLNRQHTCVVGKDAFRRRQRTFLKSCSATLRAARKRAM